MWRPRMKNPLAGVSAGALLVEMLSIIVAVALGFLVNQRREDRGNARLAAAATGALTHLPFAETRRVTVAYLAQDMAARTFDWTLQSVMTGQVRTWADARRVFHLVLEGAQIAVSASDAVLEKLGGGAAGADGSPALRP